MLWTTIRFDTRDQRHQFHTSYLRRFMAIEDREHIDLFTVYETTAKDEHSVYLPPYAAALVREELQDFAVMLQPADAPNTDQVRLMIGDTLADSPTWFDKHDEERQAIRDDCILTPDEIDAQGAEFEEPVAWMTLEEWSSRNEHRLH